MPKKTKKRKETIFLDTSIFVEKCKDPDYIHDVVHNNICSGKKIASSFFVLYEYKIGFILTLIDYYFLVQSCNDVARAFSKASNLFRRQPKYILIVNAMMLRMHESINSTDKDEYLGKLEVIIRDLIRSFNDSIDVLKGEFVNDPIANFNIKYEEDFYNFKEAYESRKLIPLGTFLEKHKDELKLIVSDTAFEKKYKKMHKYLTDIYADFDKSNKSHHNQGIGDSIIAIECGIKDTLCTTDGIFELLCPLLNKKVEKIPISK